MSKCCVIFYFVILGVVNGAKILGVFDFPGRSHHILTSSLMKALAERGHDVTIISPFFDEKPPKGGTYRQIHLNGLLKDYEKVLQMLSDILNGKSKMTPSSFMLFQTVFFENIVNVFEHKKTQKLLKANETFDLVIVEEFFNDAVKIFAAHYKTPLVLFTSQGAHYWVNRLVSNPSPFSYIPALLGTVTSTKMNFWECLTNAGDSLFHSLVTEFIQVPKHQALAKKYFPEENLDDVLYKPSIILLNSHPSMHQAVPHVPNMIEIGGFHIKPPNKLPQDLKQYLDNAKEGFIYFSMGSHLRSAELPKNAREAFLNNFRKLKQKVLWKFEEDILPNQPENVKIIKWAPQQDILAHPNIKLFISHGGLLSSTETIYYGVPILAIPVYGDQEFNAINAFYNGYGVNLPYTNLNERTLEEKLKEILNNPRYRETAKHKSKIFHDREVKPLDTAIFWVEYVLRHRGARHLMVEGVNLTWYQYLLLDAIGFILLITAMILGVGYYMLCRICHCKNKTMKRN